VFERQRQRGLSCFHDLAYTHRALEDALPWTVRYGKRRTRKEDRRWRLIPREQLCQLAACVATQDRLVKNNQADWTPIWLIRVNAERRAERARPHGVVANLAERGAQECARPLVRHHEKHSRWRRRLRWKRSSHA
jgi:hypothetical protein